jgi:hypothetical protein
MKTQDIEFISKSKMNMTLHSMLIFVEFTMLISILIFCFFTIKGFLILGHIPFSGDKEVISYNGFDRKIVMVMLYPMFYGIFVWIFLMVCGLLSSFERKRKAIIIGLILCVLNFLVMCSSQFAWIID